MSVLVNLCATIDNSFKDILEDADSLSDYAVEIRYPDDWFEPSVEETLKAFAIANNVKKLVLSKIQSYF